MICEVTFPLGADFATQALFLIVGWSGNDFWQ